MRNSRVNRNSDTKAPQISFQAHDIRLLSPIKYTGVSVQMPMIDGLHHEDGQLTCKTSLSDRPTQVHKSYQALFSSLRAGAFRIPSY